MAIVVDRQNEAAPPSRQAQHTLQTLLVTAVVQATGVLTGVLVARLLGVHGRGELAAIMLLPSVVPYVGDLGLPVAWVYESARDRRQVPALVGNALGAALVQWVVLAGLGSVLILVALQRMGTAVQVTSIAFLVGYLPLNLVTRYLNALNQGTSAFGRFNAVRLAVQLSYTLVLVLFMVAGLRSVGWVVAATLVSNVVALVLAVLLAARQLIAERARPTLDLRLLKRTLGYGLRAHVGSLTPVDALQIDLLLVVALLGAYEAGLYSVAISAAMVVRAEGTALGLVALPATAGVRGEEERARIIGRFFRTGVAMTVVTAGVVAATAGLLIPLIYGGPFAPAVAVTRILSIGIVAAALRQLLGDCLRGAGKPLQPTLAELTGWGAGLAALAVLVPMAGLTGAAIGLSIAYAGTLFVLLWFVLRSGLTVSDLLRPSWADLDEWRDLSSRLRRRLLPRTPGHAALGCRPTDDLLTNARQPSALAEKPSPVSPPE